MRKQHKNIVTDPIESIIESALINAGVKYYRYYDSLDFELENGTQIECKAAHTNRVTKQLAAHKNVILIQGKQAAETFAELLKSDKP